MKYIANPVEVEAGVITRILSRPTAEQLTMAVLVDWGDGVPKEMALTAGMVARYEPEVWDYVVRQADGYEYLNPKDVFQRKYRPAE